jgi:SPP1 family predicted phage head-tail adaptor
MIGFLKERVTLQSQYAEDNGRGGFRYEYGNTDDFWASIQPLSQSEQTRYREYSVETNVRVLVRYNPDRTKVPKAGDRLLYRDLVIEVKAVVDSLNNRDYVELLGATVYES